MRLTLAAALALLLAAPVYAANLSSIRVGVIVTGDLAASLFGTWSSRSAADGAIYHFVVNRQSGAFYQRVSVATADGRCDLRVGGSIYALERAGGGTYEMQYLVQSADLVSSSSMPDSCEDIADAYLSDSRAAARSLILSRTADGRLVDQTNGVAYSRIHH